MFHTRNMPEPWFHFNQFHTTIFTIPMGDGQALQHVFTEPGCNPADP
jgi:hypothetical protein